MLVCRGCFNTKIFAQVSERADARDVEQTAAGVVIKPWDRPDDRPTGLYCRECSNPVDPDPDIALPDDRISFVGPAEFDAEAFVSELLTLSSAGSQWARLDLPAQEATYAELPEGLAPAIRRALERSGRLPLYSHQAHAIEAAMAGEHVVQATPAGSGKSLGFVVPVLHALLEDPAATALLVFPLRALVNDQLSALARLGIHEDPWVSPGAIDLVLDEGCEPIRIARRDGSTPEYERAEARRSARVLITTPDTLHESILRMGASSYRDGTSWARLLKGLRYVVLDEVHTYQGVFGSNVSHVLRRLRRTAASVGASPQFLTASATIGNPVHLAEQLTGIGPFHLVDDDGSRRQSRIVLVCNPPLRDPEAVEGGRAEDGEPRRLAPQTIAIDLVCEGALASKLHDPVRTIGFSRSRNAVFGLSQRVRNKLKDMRRADLSNAVAPYAATFLADDRQDAEKRLRDGSTLAIFSTNALELGIDIPDLSFAVLEGYPGQISSFRQRIGRVGRSGEGVAVLIVGDDPLQQYLAREPESLAGLLDARAEDVVVNPGAPEIAQRFGLAPAIQELGGIAFEDEEYFGRELVDSWLAASKGAPARTLNGRSYFAVEVEGEPYQSIRTASGGRSFTVYRVNRRDREPIGTLDEGSAPRDGFVGAIWTGANGETYRVIDHSFDPPEILCEDAPDVGYLTRGILVDRVDIERDHRPRLELPTAAVGYGVLQITRQLVGYREQSISGAERTRELERGWPPVEFLTDGLYVQLDPSWVPDDADRDGAIRAFEHVLLSAAPVVVSCDPYDFDASSDRQAVYLYDSFGGGLRMSEAVFDRLPEILAIGHEIVATCPCATGCPGCIMLNRRPDGNFGLSKHGAQGIFEGVLASLRAQAGPGGPPVASPPEPEGLDDETVTGGGAGGHLAAGGDLPVGSVVKGQFEVLRELGSGGFASVYLVADVRTSEWRALKLFRTAASLDAAQRELSTLLRIPPHPNIVRVLFKDQMEDGQWFIVEEFVEGELLSSLIEQGSVDRDRAIDYGRQLLDALIAIHPEAPGSDPGSTAGAEAALRARVRYEQSGFVHRDVKPGNILVTQDGVVKLLDFNIASRIGDQVDTQAQTPAYFPPDTPRSRWDASPDVYAAGIVLYELLCGARPFLGERAFIEDTPIDPLTLCPGLSDPLRDFLLRACSTDREVRFATAKDMRQAFDRAVAE